MTIFESLQESLDEQIGQCEKEKDNIDKYLSAYNIRALEKQLDILYGIGSAVYNLHCRKCITDEDALMLDAKYLDYQNITNEYLGLKKIEIIDLQGVKK